MRHQHTEATRGRETLPASPHRQEASDGATYTRAALAVPLRTPKDSGRGGAIFLRGAACPTIA